MHNITAGCLVASHVNICSGINPLKDEVQEQKDQVYDKLYMRSLIRTLSLTAPPYVDM